MADKSDGFKPLPGGGIVLRRPKPAESRPGFLAGLLQRLMPQKPQPAPYWIPQDMPVSAREAPIPVAPAPVAPAALPAYNGTQAAQWAAIEGEAAKEAAIAEQLKGVSKAVMSSPAIIEGKWMTGR